MQQNGLDGTRAIAHQLPHASVQGGEPTVPELTAFVLDRYGSDEEVFDSFCFEKSNNSVRFGDIAADYDRDAAAASAFRTHPSRWVREWARVAEGRARRAAEWWRADDEELEAP